MDWDKVNRLNLLFLVNLQLNALLNTTDRIKDTRTKPDFHMGIVADTKIDKRFKNIILLNGNEEQ